MTSQYKYVVTTGWWCVENSSVADTRLTPAGANEIRGASFFKLWHAAVDQYADPVKILVVDSASPTLPELPPDPRIELLRLDRNAGHPSNHTGHLSGVTLAHICGMAYALCCDVDYWVYIEQDALIHGHGIVEKAIQAMKRDYIWGSGLGTPQPMQQSLMVVRTRAIPRFLQRLASIKARDMEITTEMKFAIAASPAVSWLPEKFFYHAGSNSLLSRARRKLAREILFRYAGGFDVLPFGYGRQRPIDFTDQHYYFQHGSPEELRSYFERVPGHR